VVEAWALAGGEWVVSGPGAGISVLVRRPQQLWPVHGLGLREVRNGLAPEDGHGQPGFAAYQRVGGRHESHTLQIFTVTAEGISRNSVFQGSEVFAAFGLAAGLDARDPHVIGVHRLRT
jgi:hypothetical protein